MAIAFDAASNPIRTIASSITLSHTIGSGSNRILIVAAAVQTSKTITLTATFNGVSMTEIGHIAGAANGSSWLFYIINPPTGANNIVVTASAGGDQLTLCGASYTGVNQTTQPDASNTGTDSTDPYTLAVTTILDNCWVVGGFYNGDGTASNAGTATTKRTTDSNNCGILIVDNNAAKTPAGSVTLAVTSSGAENKIVVASLSPATSLSVSVTDDVAVSESLTMNLEDDPSINDTVTITEAVTMMVDLNISLFDGVTVADVPQVDTSNEPSVFDTVTITESVTLQIVSGPNGDDLITVDDTNLTVLIDQLVPSVAEDIAVTEAVTMESDMRISVGEDVAIAESLSVMEPDEAIIGEDIAVTESVAVMVSLEPNVNDGVAVSDSGVGQPVVVAAPRSDLVHMRSTEQDYPLMMDEDEVR